MKKYSYLLLMMYSSVVMAQQDIVFKCADSSGNVIYLNEKETMAKDVKCNKTNLGAIDKRITTNSANTKNNNIQSNTESINMGSVKPPINNEQKLRDDKRLFILNQELIQEQSYLLDKEKTLINAEKSNDSALLSKFKNEIEINKRNIDAIKKEISKITFKTEININPNLLSSVSGPKPPDTLPGAIANGMSNSNTPTSSFGIDVAKAKGESTKIENKKEETNDVGEINLTVKNTLPIEKNKSIENKVKESISGNVNNIVVQKPKQEIKVNTTIITPSVKTKEVKKSISPTDFLLK